MGRKQTVSFSQDQLVAMYGILFSVAYADGELSKDELKKIYEIMNTEGFSAEAMQTVMGFLTETPNLDVHIGMLQDEIEEIRFCVYSNSIDVVMCNDECAPQEMHMLKKIRDAFHITDEQHMKLWEFSSQMKKIAERGIDDKYAEDALKAGVSGLAAVGIPVAAVYFSGSVVGLSAAGITSGLAAIGLGFGMVPGIGIAVLIGTAVFLLGSKLLDIGGKNKKEIARVEREKRAEKVIRNLQESINHIIDKMQDYEEKARQAEANKMAVEELEETLRKLKRILNSKSSNANMAAIAKTI